MSRRKQRRVVRSVSSRKATLSRSTFRARKVHLDVSDAELERRRAAMEARGDNAWKPAAPRKRRRVTMALKAYAAHTTSAALGAVRVVPE